MERAPGPFRLFHPVLAGGLTLSSTQGLASGGCSTLGYRLHPVEAEEAPHRLPEPREAIQLAARTIPGRDDDVGYPTPRPRVAARGPRSEQHQSRDQRVAGLLLSLAGGAILMASITAEALYPRVFTTHTDTLSHLGATEPPNSVALQPSAAIFDLTMLLAGAMILAGAWLAYRALRRRAGLIPTALLGIGVLGVGIFPLTHQGPHTLFALTAFYAGGIAVILASRITTAPFRYVWMTLGAIALVAITLGIFLPEWTPIARLGEGGIERWNAYPIVLWLVAFGSYLMAAPTAAATKAAAASG